MRAWDEGVASGPGWRPFFASWARMEPRRGAYDGGVLEECRRALVAARRAGIEPVVVAHSGALPDWQIARDGWLDPDALAAWGCFVDRLGAELGDAVRYWAALWTPLDEARAYDADARRVARVLLDAQSVAYLHLRRGPGYGGTPASVGIVEDWGSLGRRILADAFVKCLATGRLAPPFGLIGELPDGTPAVDFVGVRRGSAEILVRLWSHGRPIVSIGGEGAEEAEARGVRLLARL